MQLLWLMVIMHFLVCDFKRTTVAFCSERVLRYVGSFMSVMRLKKMVQNNRKRWGFQRVASAIDAIVVIACDSVSFSRSSHSQRVSSHTHWIIINENKKFSDIRCPSAHGTLYVIAFVISTQITSKTNTQTHSHTRISRCFYTQLIGAYASDPIVSSIVFLFFAMHVPCSLFFCLSFVYTFHSVLL